MTNEQLIRQYYDGDEAALEKLYYKNIGLIRGIAKETAAQFSAVCPRLGGGLCYTGGSRCKRRAILRRE